jgi:hypothetical protein
MFLNSSRQRFKIPRKNEDCESMVSSENEILGGCAASPDTFHDFRWFFLVAEPSPLSRELL